MEAIIFYTYFWQRFGTQLQIYGRTNTGKAVIITVGWPLEFDSLHILWVMSNYRPCAWYRLSSYSFENVEGTLYINCNWSDLEMLNLALMPTLNVLAVDDSEGDDDVTIYVEDSAHRRVFKFGDENVNSPFYVQGDYRTYLPELLSLFRVDIEFYSTQPYTNVVVHLPYEDLPPSFWFLLSQECAYANEHLENLI